MELSKQLQIKRSKAKVKIKANKKLTGRELKAEEFEFTLTDQDGKVKETVKNDKDGTLLSQNWNSTKQGLIPLKLLKSWQ